MADLNGTTSTLGSYAVTAETTAWQPAPTVDISAYAGQTIQLRWYFRADQSQTFPAQSEGWYVDDILVTANGVSLISEDFSQGLGRFEFQHGAGSFWHLSAGRSAQARATPPGRASTSG